ncbi:DUF177 domain-containing protein [Listeria sp. PSOL-1]|uniref:YceD family protein n=1 Tax=Listeria sp. PSOL-1 TaxID=1844999 RepID=UPI0013D66EAB|nr:DUF177 domain-containing protein [Listeria sp. PSOL-1]
MKWSLSQLKKSADDRLKIDEMVDLKSFLQKSNKDVRDASLVHVVGEQRIKNNEVTADFTLSGTWTLPCARTLVDVVYPYEIFAHETFVQKKEQLMDESWHLIEQDRIDLLPVIEELLLVEIPMQVFSEEALNEKDLPKGNDWELKTEEENLAERKKNEPKVDPRLANLADFFNKDQDS